MTANDAPRTLLEAVVRELQSAAYDGALDVALGTTPAETALRRTAVEAANRAHERDMREEAEKLITYLAERFGVEITGTMPLLHDDRPPLNTIPDAATHTFGPPQHCRTCGEHGHTEESHPRSAGTERFPVTGPLAELWRDHLGRRDGGLPDGL